MIKTASYIRQEYQKIYNNLENHYGILMSPEFSLPSESELIDAIKRHSVKDMQYRDNIADCEKFAWYLVWGIQMERSFDPFNDGRTWAVGWINGIRGDILNRTSHTMCTAMTSDKGIVIIDPMSDNISKPDPSYFDAYLFVM